jgi:hypothetical protein
VDVVHTVTIDAVRDRRVAGGKTLAVHAGFVLRKLVHSLLWLEFVNESGVGVAAAAERRHGRSGDSSE